MDSNRNTPPQICGHYSISSDRSFDESVSALRYFKKPKCPLDLNIGIENIKEKPDSYYEEKMDHILKYITRNKSKFLDGSTSNTLMGTPLIPCTEYITYRGILRMILCSPYEHRNGWYILATKYKGNIYLCQLTKESKRKAFRNEPFSKKRYCYYGPKFEQYCLTADPSESPNTTEQIDACTQFFCIFKRMLVGRKFLFAGEMDGVDSDRLVNLDHPKSYEDLKFVELKVSANSNIKIFEKFKCQNVWTQNFLTGVEDIYFGFRDFNGIVDSISHYDIKKLHSLWTKYLDANEGFQFMNNFLERVEREMREVDCPDTVYEFELNEITKKISMKIHEGKTKLSLLPEWYIRAMT